MKKADIGPIIEKNKKGTKIYLKKLQTGVTSITCKMPEHIINKQHHATLGETSILTDT